MRVAAVLFDAVGTLIQPRRPVAHCYGQIGRRHGFALSETRIGLRFASAFARQEAKDAEAGDWATDDNRERARWREIVFDVFKIDEPSVAARAMFDELWSYFAAPSSWHVYEDAAVAVTELARRQLVHGIASNMDARLAPICAELNPLSTCRHLFISSQLGVRKPSREFFAAIECSLNLPAEQILLVGDDYESDYKAALNCGWQALWLRRDAQTFGQGMIGNLEALLPLLA